MDKTKDFVNKAVAVHGNAYDYSKVVYVKALLPVSITHTTCGTEFLQRPSNHLNGQRCPKCFGAVTKSKEELENIFTSTLPDQVVDLSVYRVQSDSVPVYCKIHKTIEHKSITHLLTRKTGCNKCAKDSLASAKQQEQTTKFFNVVAEKFSNLYDYSLSTYVSATTKLTIICKRCGIHFDQIPHNHVRGAGCPRCATDSYGWGKHRFKNKPTILYVLKIGDNYKVGITKRSVRRRYSGEKTPYEVIYQVTCLDGELAWNAEKHVLRVLHKHQTKGARVLSSTSNREVLSISPEPEIQKYLKGLADE